MRSIANIYPASPLMVRPNGISAHTLLDKWSASRAIIKVRVECAGSIRQPIFRSFKQPCSTLTQ